MSYATDLDRLKAAVARAKRRKTPARWLACCVCSGTPTVATRFGPRCASHLPPPPLDTPDDSELDNVGCRQ